MGTFIVSIYVVGVHCALCSVQVHTCCNFNRFCWLLKENPSCTETAAAQMSARYLSNANYLFVCKFWIISFLVWLMVVDGQQNNQ